MRSVKQNNNQQFSQKKIKRILQISFLKFPDKVEINNSNLCEENWNGTAMRFEKYIYQQVISHESLSIANYYLSLYSNAVQGQITQANEFRFHSDNIFIKFQEALKSITQIYNSILSAVKPYKVRLWVNLSVFPGCQNILSSSFSILYLMKHGAVLRYRNFYNIDLGNTRQITMPLHISPADQKTPAFLH